MKNFNLWIPKLVRPYRRKMPSGFKGVGVKGLVVCVLTDPWGRPISKTETENIVTNDGDLFYAELCDAFFNSTEPTNFTNGAGTFDGIMELYDNTGNAPGKASDRSDAGTIIGTGKVIDTNYPMNDDQDADNTGAGADIVTYLTTFTTGEVNGSIDEVIITNPSPGASEAVILFADGLNTTKTSANGLKVFVNHEMLGV